MSRSVRQVLAHASPASPSSCASPPSGRPSRCLRPGRQVRRRGLESLPVLWLSRLRLRCSSSFSSSMSSYASASAFMRPRFPKRPLLLLLLLLLQRRFFSVLFSVPLLRPTLRQCPVLPRQERQKCSASKSTGCSPSFHVAPHIPQVGHPTQHSFAGGRQAERTTTINPRRAPLRTIAYMDYQYQARSPTIEHTIERDRRRV